MMNDHLAGVLASSLEAIEKGELTLEQCLALYPEYGEELEALLGTAASIQARATFAPRPGYPAASRARLVKSLGRRQPSRSFLPRFSFRPRSPLALSRRVAFATVIVIVMVASMAGGGTVYASQAALPGDSLYPVKLAVEETRLVFSDDLGDVSLAFEFLQKRTDEIQALVVAGREEDLPLAVETFSSQIDAAAEALAAVAQEDVGRAAPLALALDQALLNHSKVLGSVLETAPEKAKPALEKAISASNKGLETVHDVFEDKPGGPPENAPGQNKTPPGKKPSEDSPDLDATPRHGPPDGVPGLLLTPGKSQGRPDWLPTLIPRAPADMP
jgi:hypothetical protein